MSLEKPGFNPEQPSEAKKESSPKRLMLSIEALLKLQVGKVEVSGQEHLKDIPPNRKLVIATTHISDLDVPITVGSLGHDLDLAVVNMSVHHSLREEAGTFLGVMASGRDNYIPVDFNRDKETGVKTAGLFNPQNFEPMRSALNKGKRVLIAAHNPSHDAELGEPGYGAAYLAELEGAMILPVGVQLLGEKELGMYGTGAKTFAHKPDAKVSIGQPFELEKIQGLEELGQIMAKRQSGEKLTKENLQRFSELKKSLKEQSEILLQHIAGLLPESE